MAAERSVAGSGPQHHPHPDPAAEPPARPERPARAGRYGFLAGALLTIVLAVLVLWLPHRSGDDARAAGSPVPPAWDRLVVSAAGLAERSGVRLTQVAVTGGGGLIDLRFQVVDPDKAAALHDQRTPPALVDEQTGMVVNQLFMGHAHQGAYQTGVKYYLVFNNPGNWVHRGGMVTVLLGDAEVQHVAVG